MKNFIRISVLVMVLFSGSIYAQEDTDLQLFTKDMLFLADNFASPAAESAAYQGTAGWFTSAAALDKWKVDVSFHGNALFVPSSKKEFSIGNGDFGILQIMGDNSKAVLPTAFGGATDLQFEGKRDIEIQERDRVPSALVGQKIPISGLDALDGIDKGALFYPFAQVSVGLPFETEIAVRALPELEVDGSKVSTYGVALKHNFSQYFGGFHRKKNEDLQLAAVLSYNIFNVKYGFDPVVVPGVVTFNLIDVDADMIMGEVLASKRYENFEIFGAFGVAKSNFDYEFDGSGIGLPLINEELKTLSDSEAQFKGDIGFNLYFSKFKISTMATAGKFFNVNLGLHFML